MDGARWHHLFEASESHFADKCLSKEPGASGREPFEVYSIYNTGQFIVFVFVCGSAGDQRRAHPPEDLLPPRGQPHSGGSAGDHQGNVLLCVHRPSSPSDKRCLYSVEDDFSVCRLEVFWP